MNSSPNKVIMAHRDPMDRKNDFEEVQLGYLEEEARLEAERCIDCKKKPCMAGCPVSIEIPQFIKKIQEGDFLEAHRVISRNNILPAICGRVCPQESQCERLCVRGKQGEPVAIGRLERFVGDWYLNHGRQSDNRVQPAGPKVAIVGSGPSGLACASELASNGYRVTIYEALHELGGVLRYGIPEFRLPKKLLDQEITKLTELGVTIETNVLVGKSLTLDDLFSKGFQSVFIGVGAGLPNFMNIEGESFNGVYSANEFLTRVNLMKAFEYPRVVTPIKVGRRVAVVGGGNVAMDAARTAIRLGAESVQVIYRRGMDQLPARKEEVEHAIEEGVQFSLLVGPVEIIGEHHQVTGIKLIKMDLLEDGNGSRKRPVPVEGSEHVVPMDTIIIAIGQKPNPILINSMPSLKKENNSCLVIDEETFETSVEKVYAGGDIVTGAATVIKAMAAGRSAAKSIMEQVSKGEMVIRDEKHQQLAS